MPELRVAFDPCNPGQFYACCGLIELFDLTGARTFSHFQMNRRQPRNAELVLESESQLDLGLVARAICEAKYQPFQRPAAEDKTPDKDSIAPAKVLILGKEIVLDWWLDWFHEKACSLKCWAGQVTTQKLVSMLPSRIPSRDLSFEEGVLTTTRFGIDPRSAWVALNLGYSPNEQGQESRTYAAVEMLGAFGLQGFRPAGTRSEGFTYHLWLSPLSRAVARSICAEPWSGFACAGYRFTLGERGSYKYFSFAEPVAY